LNSTVKQVLIWVLMLACLAVGWQFVVKNVGAGHDKAISMTDLQNDAEQGKVGEVTVDGTSVTGKYKDGKESFHSTIPQNYPEFYTDLRQHGVNVTVKDSNNNLWLGVLIQLAPIALLIGLLMFMMRQMQSGGNKAMSFGKNKARLLSMQQKKVTFKDVAGVDEAKEELKAHSQGRSDGRASGHGQDAAGACGGG
jgi:cell division protease FtsH